MNAETINLPEIETLTRIDLQPGDIVVASVAAAMSGTQREGLNRQLQSIFQTHRVIVVTGEGIKLAIMNEAQEPALVVMAREIARLHDRLDDLIDKLVEEEPKIETDLDGNAMPPERDQSKAL